MAKNKLEIIISAKDQTKGVFKNLDTSLGNLAKMGLKAGAVGLGVITAAAGVAGSALIKIGMDAAKLGPIKDAFEDIAEASGKSADAVLAAMKKSSKGMITNTDLMKQYSLASQLVGTQFANELPDAMGYLSRVAAATGEDMGFMMDSLVRGIGRLSPEILDNLFIQVDLAKAYEDFAAKNGLVVDEMSKTEQQAALMAQAMELLAENTKDMADASDPFVQIQVAIKDAWEEMAIVLGQELLPYISDMAEALVAFVQSEQFKQWIQDTAKYLRNDLLPYLSDIAVKIGDELPGIIQAFDQAWANIKPGLLSIWTVIKNIADALGTLDRWLRRIDISKAFPLLAFNQPGGLQGLKDSGVIGPGAPGTFIPPTGSTNTNIPRMILPPSSVIPGVNVTINNNGISLGNQEEIANQLTPILQKIRWDPK